MPRGLEISGIYEAWPTIWFAVSLELIYWFHFFESSTLTSPCFLANGYLAKTWCSISSMCGVLLCGASILHLCAISIERLIAIKWPLSYDIKVTPKRIVILLIYIWLQSFVLAIFPALGLAEHRFSPVMSECEIHWLKDPTLTILLLVFYFFLPVTIMVVAYAIIFKEVRRNSRRISTIESSGSQRGNNKLKREMKAAKNTSCCCRCFLCNVDALFRNYNDSCL